MGLEFTRHQSRFWKLLYHGTCHVAGPFPVDGRGFLLSGVGCRACKGQSVNRFSEHVLNGANDHQRQNDQTIASGPRKLENHYIFNRKKHQTSSNQMVDVRVFHVWVPAMVCLLWQTIFDATSLKTFTKLSTRSSTSQLLGKAQFQKVKRPVIAKTNVRICKVFFWNDAYKCACVWPKEKVPLTNKPVKSRPQKSADGTSSGRYAANRFAGVKLATENSVYFIPKLQPNHGISWKMFSQNMGFHRLHTFDAKIIAWKLLLSQLVRNGRLLSRRVDGWPRNPQCLHYDICVAWVNEDVVTSTSLGCVEQFGS